MSQFKTVLPVDIEAVKKLLPKDHNIEAVRFDAVNTRLELFWHSSTLQTPHTFATEFSVDDLKAKKLPATARIVERHLPKPPEPTPVIAAPKVAKPKKPKKPKAVKPAPVAA